MLHQQKHWVGGVGLSIIVILYEEIWYVVK